MCVCTWVDERHIVPTFPNPEFLALFHLVVEGEVKGGALCDRGGGASAGHGTGGDTAVWKTKSQHPIKLKHADVLIIWLLVSLTTFLNLAVMFIYRYEVWFHTHATLSDLVGVGMSPSRKRTEDTEDCRETIDSVSQTGWIRLQRHTASVFTSHSNAALHQRQSGSWFSPFMVLAWASLLLSHTLLRKSSTCLRDSELCSVSRGWIEGTMEQPSKPAAEGIPQKRTFITSQTSYSSFHLLTGNKN